MEAIMKKEIMLLKLDAESRFSIYAFTKRLFFFTTQKKSSDLLMQIFVIYDIFGTATIVLKFFFLLISIHFQITCFSVWLKQFFFQNRQKTNRPFPII